MFHRAAGRPGQYAGWRRRRRASAGRLLLKRAKVTGVILAGGRGTRAGGADKGLLPYRGRPLIEWVIDCLAPQVDELLISANRNIERYARYGYAVLSDLTPDFPGPLGGIQAALHCAAGDWLVTAPCDTPHLPVDLVPRMLEHDDPHRDVIAVAATPDGWQPTIALIPRSAVHTLQRYLAGNRRRVREWIAEQPHRVVQFDLPGAFANLNDWPSAADDSPATEQ